MWLLKPGSEALMGEFRLCPSLAPRLGGPYPASK